MYLDKILGWIRIFNDSYSNAVIAIIAILGATIGWIYKNIYKESKMKDNDAAYIVKPVFYALGRKYKILAVHQYQVDDDAASGFKHLKQNSRTDQWKKLIEIKSF